MEKIHSHTTDKQGMGMHDDNFSNWKVKAKRSGIQGHHQLQ